MDLGTIGLVLIIAGLTVRLAIDIVQRLAK
jgi:hypothetical protein